MLQFRNFGQKSLEEIAEILQRHGLHFGMSVEGTPESGYVLKNREELRSLPEVAFDFDETDGGGDGNEEPAAAEDEE